MRRVICVAAAATLTLAWLPTAGAQDTPAPCAYDAAHPAPVNVGKLPAQVVPGRIQAVRVRPRADPKNRKKLLNPHLSALAIRFERVSDAAETFHADLLKAYKAAKPNANIGYDVKLTSDSPGERAVVTWTDANPGQPGQPCTGEASSGDMAVVSAARRQRPSIKARSGATDAVRGDSALLSIGGKGRGCPLTDPAKLSVVATSAGVKKTLELDMACGDWTGAISARVDRFTLLAEDGDYAGATRLYVSPRANPTPGAQLTLTVRKGKTTLATKKFHVMQTSSGRARVVAG